MAISTGRWRRRPRPWPPQTPRRALTTERTWLECCCGGHGPASWESRSQPHSKHPAERLCAGRTPKESSMATPPDLASLMARVEQHLDQRELTQMCLDLGNIESPFGGEGEAGQYVYDWLADNDFAPRKVGMIEERFNVVGTLTGEDGPSLLFNSHLDTGRRRGDTWVLRDPDKDFYHRAWVEDGVIVGDGVINDKGPLAAFALAVRAIRDAGIRLRGDVYL